MKNHNNRWHALSIRKSAYRPAQTNKLATEYTGLRRFNAMPIVGLRLLKLIFQRLFFVLFFVYIRALRHIRANRDSETYKTAA